MWTHTTTSAIVEPTVNELVVIKTTLPANCNLYRDEIEKYDWDINIAMQIINLESGCNPTNHNLKDNHKHYLTGETICLGSYNLFNVGCIHYNGEDINDWKKNVELAYRVYKSSGWNAWSTYKKVI